MSCQRIEKAYIAGDVDADSAFSSFNNRRSRARLIISGGDFAGTVQGFYVDRVLVGYDQNEQRRIEDDTYTGSDFTGTVTSYRTMKYLSVTGMIDGASISSSRRTVGVVLAEDGII